MAAPSALTLALERLCDLWFVAFGGWTLLAVASYFLGGSFVTLIACALAAGALSTAWAIYRRAEHRGGGSYYPTHEHVLLAIFALLAVVLTLCLNRPDDDDRFYLGLSLLVLDHPDTAVRNIPAPRAFQTGFALTSYELLKSAVTYLTGIPILYAYYLLIPAVFSVLVVLVHWRLLRLLVGPQWTIALGFVFIVMLSWADAHRTHANFGFVRLFQGKACFVSIVVPALIFYFLKFHQTGERWYAVVLFFALAAGIGLTPSGIVIGMLTVGMLLLANADRIVTSVRGLLVWGAVLLVPLAAGLLMIFYFQHASRGASVALAVRDRVTNYDTLMFVLGPGFRGWFALVCFAVSPWIVADRAIRRMYARFVILCLILVLIPWTSEVISAFTSTTAAWRWLWMIPFPAAMGVVVGGLWGFRPRPPMRPGGAMAAVVLSLAYVLCNDRRVVGEWNQTRWTRPDFKLTDPTQIYILYYDETARIHDGYLHLDRSGQRF